MKNRFTLLISVLAVLSFSSCQEDEHGGGGGGTGSPGRFEDFESCVIIAPPSEVELNPFYTKYINCSGIPVIGSADVPDEAFAVANETMEFMFLGLDEVRDKLIQRGEYYILIPPGQVVRDMPEFVNETWATEAAGVYSSSIRAGTSKAAGLLCLEPNPDGHQNVMIHELAHMMAISGLRHVEPNFESALVAAYNNALSEGTWANTYSATNKREYFASGMQVYFEVGWPFGPAGGDGSFNDIVTRAQLEQSDPTLYDLIASRFNSSLNVPGCIQGENYTPYVDPNINCGTSVTDIDGNTYGVVRIGNQCWMSENLKTTRYRNGTQIQNVTDNAQWGALTNGAWCFYDGQQSNGNTYGKLYNWKAIDNSADLCPNGWHVATQQDWQTLLAFAATYGSGTGGALKSLELWGQPNEGATNETGFSALPAGVRRTDGNFEGLTSYTSYWSDQMDGNDLAVSYNIWENGSFTLEQSHDIVMGKSCRCVKDD